MSADTPKSSAFGSTFVVPAGWSYAETDNARLLEGPEHDYKLAIVDVKGVADADEATRRAWTALEPKFAWKLKLAQDRPPRRGWEARRASDYEVSPNERRQVAAIACKHGDSFTVLLLDGSEQAGERRGGQIEMLWESLRPAGYSRESFKGKTAHALDAERIKRITDLLDGAREQANVPGFAVSLVQDGKVVLSKGFGWKDVAKKAPVDDRTLFLIASNTKALTTLALAEEVDDGKFTWETPATKVWPEFKLGSAETTASVLMRHLVCACTGMPRQDLEMIFEFAKATPETSMATLGTFQPTSKFGEVFQYSNLMAAAAGYIGAYADSPKMELGAAYDKMMQKRVFGPLGMTSTTFEMKRALAGDHASPYAHDIDGHLAPTSMDLNYAFIPVRPAGGAWSNVRDMTHYVQLELAKGVLPDGKRLVSEESLMQRRKPNVAVGEDATYGMGLEVTTEWGITLIHHGGSLMGFKSDMFWLPEYGVGGVILTNSDDGYAFLRPFYRKVVEELFDGKAEAAGDLAGSLKLRDAAIAEERSHLTLPPDAAVVSKLAARYTSDALGDIKVVRRGANGTEVVFDFGEMRSTMATRKNDDGTMSLSAVSPGLEGIPFVVGEKNGKRTLTLRDAQHEYVFTET